MTLLLRSLLVGIVALSCIGCQSPGYKITLKDGREFVTATRPEFDPKIGYYRYRGLNNKKALIRADEVLLLNEL
ncbi:MAG: YgdI/YgdR family lipoprotein, partial [Roseimicrobium sp.]